MKSSIEMLLSFMFLVAYCYTIMKAHSLLSGIDMILPVPKNSEGKFSLSLIKIWCKPELEEKFPSLKTSIVLLTINDYIVFAYFAFLIGALFFETMLPHNPGMSLTSLNHH